MSASNRTLDCCYRQAFSHFLALRGACACACLELTSRFLLLRVARITCRPPYPRHPCCACAALSSDPSHPADLSYVSIVLYNVRILRESYPSWLESGLCSSCIIIFCASSYKALFDFGASARNDLALCTYMFVCFKG